MDNKISYRKARFDDLHVIVELLQDDDVVLEHEISSDGIHESYINAFYQIDANPHQYLMVVECEGEIIGTCHLTMLIYLNNMGSTRMEIESVRIAKQYRGQGYGKWMINAAIAYAKERNVKIIQFTSSKKRLHALSFYEDLGFEAIHEGFKMYLHQ
jgi:N-acetylglutamate synthase-like GNAT family acetyltransferase